VGGLKSLRWTNCGKTGLPCLKATTLESSVVRMENSRENIYLARGKSHQEMHQNICFCAEGT